MVEQRANLDYGADDRSLEDDLTHEPAPVEDDGVTERTPDVDVTEDVVDDELADEENAEASTYGAP